jgi:hypothetical protein
MHTRFGETREMDEMTTSLQLEGFKLLPIRYAAIPSFNESAKLGLSRGHYRYSCWMTFICSLPYSHGVNWNIAWALNITETLACFSLTIHQRSSMSENCSLLFPDETSRNLIGIAITSQHRAGRLTGRHGRRRKVVRTWRPARLRRPSNRCRMADRIR